MATPGFWGHVERIGSDIADHMRGASWHPDDPRCPTLDDLRLVRVAHIDLDGATRDGELVVAAAVASEVVAVFEALYAARFPIAQIVRIDHFGQGGGDDDASMAANNCSAFNFRTIAGTDVLSQHALGLAVDINPVFNPWVRGDTVLPPSGEVHLRARDRGEVTPGMIVRPGPVTDAFDAAGWTWGGDWDDTKDYHHFSKLPR